MSVPAGRRSPFDDEPHHRAVYALHLLWTIPLAVLLCVPFGYWAVLSLAGPLPSTTPSDPAGWMVPVVCMGFLLGLAMGVVPWGRWYARLLAGIVVAASITGILFALVLHGSPRSDAPLGRFAADPPGRSCSVSAVVVLPSRT